MNLMAHSAMMRLVILVIASYKYNRFCGKMGRFSNNFCIFSEKP